MPTARTREYILSKLTNCGTLSYQDMVDLLYSIAFLYEVGGGSGGTFLEYNENDLVSDSGHVYLPQSMTGSQHPTSMLVVDNTTGVKQTHYPAYLDDGVSPEGIYDQFFIDGTQLQKPQKIYIAYSGIPVAGTPPTITTNIPSAKEIMQNDDLVLTVVAAGATSYQWKKNGVAISGATTNTLTVTDFNALKNGTFVCDVTNSSGTVSSTACVVTNDEGIKFYNATHVNHLNIPSPGGRDMVVSDGVYTRTAPFDTFIRVRTAATAINIKQNGVDNLFFENNGSLTVVNGGNVDNIKVPPFIDPMFLYNEN